jgi:hypothetical protein
MLLGPAVAFHVAMAAWCITSLLKTDGAVLR